MMGQKKVQKCISKNYFTTTGQKLAFENFLEASFLEYQGFFKILKNSPEQILRNLVPKIGSSRQIDGLLHNVALDVQFVQRFMK